MLWLVIAAALGEALGVECGPQSEAARLTLPRPLPPGAAPPLLVSVSPSALARALAGPYEYPRDGAKV